MTGKENRMGRWAAVSLKEELSACSGVYDFQELVRRWLLLEEETGTAPKQNWKNCCRKSGNLTTNELGYGVVPIEPSTEMAGKTGRICTELAAKADSVTRGVRNRILLKGEEKHDP